VLKVAVIGLGDVSGIHLEAIRNSSEAELVAVCDIDESRKEAAPDVNFYTDYLEMLDKEDLNCVHVCLPHYLHFPVTKACVEKGIHVYLEKPMTKDVYEGVELVEFCRKHPNVKVCVSLQNRFNDPFVEMQRIIDSEELGKVVGIKGLVVWNRPKAYYDVKPWRGLMKYAGGGVMINQAIHTMDQMQVIGGEIESIRGTVDQLVNYGYEVEDTATAHIRFKSGATGVFFATTTYTNNSSVELQVILEKGKLTIKDFMLFITDSDGNKQPIKEDAKLPGTKFYYGASHNVLIGKFYKAIIENTDDYVHVEDGLITMEMIDAIYKSSNLKIPISMEVYR